MNSVRQKYGDKELKTEIQIPDSLCCKITLDMMQDPYITAAGMTYEKDALL